MDIKSKLNIREPDNAATYFITLGDLTPNEASFISPELVNKAFSYLLTAADIIEIAITALNTDPFVYSTNAEL